MFQQLIMQYKDNTTNYVNHKRILLIHNINELFYIMRGVWKQNFHVV